MKYINAYLEYLQVIKKYSDKTINSYRIDLIEYNEFLQNEFVNILDIDFNLVEKYLKFLYLLNLNKNTISRKLSSVRGLYNYLIKEDIITNNYFNEVSNPKKEFYLPKFLKEDELDKLFAVCKEDNSFSQRDTLIIEMLYATGLRVSELVNIKISDIDLKERTIKVLGKGNKERIVIYNNHTKEALDLYLKDGFLALNKKNSGYLILNKDGNKLSERYIRIIINKLVRKASLDIKISPHSFRHTFATDMLENGADLMTVKELLGHESLNTTSIYTHVTNEQIKRVYDFAHPRAVKK